MGAFVPVAFATLALVFTMGKLCLVVVAVQGAPLMFMYLMDKIHIGLNNTEFTHLKNTITQISLVMVEVFYYRVTMHWLDHMVSALFSVFSKYSLTVT